MSTKESQMLFKGKRARAISCLGCVVLLGLTGCDFFVSQGNTPTNNSGDYLYVANAADTFVAGFGVSSAGALSVLSNSPYNNGVAGLSLAVSRANTFLYIGTSNGIYEYAIGSNGALTVQNSGNAVAQDVLPSEMQVDSTGNYLLAAGISPASTLQVIGIYQINTSSGLLTAVSGSPLNLYTGTGSQPTINAPTGMLITPNNANVYVSLGNLGVQVLTLGTGGALSTGKTATILPPNSKSTSPADYGLASDPNSKFLFVCEYNTGLRVLSIGTGGALNEVSGSPYTTGAGPTGAIVDPTGAYVYVANKGNSLSTAGTINGFSLNATSGALTAISGSPFSSGGAQPIAFASDGTKKYLAVINAGDNGSNSLNDLQLFSYSTTTPGALVPVSTASTGTDPTNPSSVAATFPPSS
jgi:6-phosphogluconolactonase